METAMTINLTTLGARTTGVPAVRGALQAAAERGVRLAERLWNAYWDQQARRATAMILHALDDRTLADIGLRRSEISGFVYGPAEEGRRAYDAAWHLRSP